MRPLRSISDDGVVAISSPVRGPFRQHQYKQVEPLHLSIPYYRSGERCGGPRPLPHHPIRREKLPAFHDRLQFLQPRITDIMFRLGMKCTSITLERRGDDKGVPLTEVHDTLLIETASTRSFANFYEAAFDRLRPLLRLIPGLNLEISYYQTLLPQRAWSVGYHKIHRMWATLEGDILGLLSVTPGLLALSYWRFGPHTLGNDDVDRPIEIDIMVPKKSTVDWVVHINDIVKLLDIRYQLKDVGVRITRSDEIYLAAAGNDDPLANSFWIDNEAVAGAKRGGIISAGRSGSKVDRITGGTYGGALLFHHGPTKKKCGISNYHVISEGPIDVGSPPADSDFPNAIENKIYKNGLKKTNTRDVELYNCSVIQPAAKYINIAHNRAGTRVGQLDLAIQDKRQQLNRSKDSTTRVTLETELKALTTERAEQRALQLNVARMRRDNIMGKVIAASGKGISSTNCVLDFAVIDLTKPDNCSNSVSLILHCQFLYPC
jgi:hypothetical protein